MTKLNIAYLTSEYPAVSHTFIRREVTELERRGHNVLRLSIRRNTAIIDEIDLNEAKKTFYCLERNIFLMLIDCLIIILSSPRLAANAICILFKLHCDSNRGVLKHLAYYVEACVICRYSNKFSISHIHVHFGTNPTSVALLVKTLGGPGYSMTIHGPDEFDSPVMHSLSLKVESAKFVVAISHYCSAQIKRWVSFNEWEKIKIVRCTVSTEMLNMGPVPLIENHNTLVCVGRLSAQKGHNIIIDAVKILKDRGILVKVIFAGDGELRNNIEERISELDLQDNILITGWITGGDVVKYLVNSKGLLLASFAEGLPVVIMESFAIGRPVIATSIAGIPELVKDGGNGCLTISGDVDGLVETINNYCNYSVNELNDMAAIAYKDVSKMHNVKTEIAILENLFFEAT